MAQLNDITFGENGKILFVHNRICLKSDCKSPKLYQKTILLMTPEEQHNLKKQILVPSVMFSQFETKSTGEKLVADEYSNKVALCFQHLTRKTQNYYLKHKALPDWAEIKQHPNKVGKVHVPDPKRGQKYYWSGLRYSRQALNQLNLFELPKTNTVEIEKVASLENEHSVQPISDSTANDIQSAMPLPSTSVRLNKRWHADQLRSESSDESDSDAVIMVEAKKSKFTEKEQLAVVLSVITSSKSTQTLPTNEDSAHYLIIQKALASQLQVEQLKNQKLTEELELSKLDIVKLLAQVEKFKMQLAKRELQSMIFQGSPSLLHKAKPSTLTPGERIEIIML